VVPPVRFDVAGVGDGVMVDPKRARSRKRRIQPRTCLHTTAPILDPTTVSAHTRVHGLRGWQQASIFLGIIPSRIRVEPGTSLNVWGKDMMEKQLELVVDTADSNSLQLTTTGKIYPDVPDGKVPPVVTGISASPGSKSGFVLKPGKYAYRFSVNIAGKFTVNIGEPSKLDPKTAKPFDITSAKKGRVYRFEVKP
ncbi:hypothetical protein, partial [Archangium sp.]|uniref:hypothetical protein n=1 Tax=Archangium sp. TaxID=1872627 RepID=UPI002D24806C